MHFVYFAQEKLERFYDFLVERTEQSVTKKSVKGVEGKVGAKGKAKLGKLLSLLGIAELEIEAEVSATGKLSFERDVVTKFTAPQKLKALLLKLNCEDKLVALTDSSELEDLPEEGSPTFFTARLKTDFERRPKEDVEKTAAAVLTGHIGEVSVEIQASIQYMESDNAWRRWGHPKQMVGLGTLIGSYEDEKLLEFDPIVLAYAQPS
jgi:hypothetical protein